MSKRSEERAARLAATAAALKAGTPPPEGGAPSADAPAADEGRVVMEAPDGSTGCSFAGEAYDADEDGFVQVPPEAVSTLLEHGFTLP